MVLLRHLLGDALRRLRLRQGRTLREVSASARVSLGYLSEVERGQKEASSELLAAICSALQTPLSQVLREVSDNFALAELQTEPVYAGVSEPAGVQGGSAGAEGAAQVPVGPVASARLTPGGRTMVPAGVRLPMGSDPRLPMTAPRRLIAPAPPKVGARSGQHGVPVLDQAAQPVVELVTRTAREITSMLPV